jgi:hypothetical protein
VDNAALEKRTCATESNLNLHSPKCCRAQSSPLIIPGAWIRGMDFWIYEITHTLCFVFPFVRRMTCNYSRGERTNNSRVHQIKVLLDAHQNQVHPPQQRRNALVGCQCPQMYIYKLSACAWPAAAFFKWVCVYLSLSLSEAATSVRKNVLLCGEV